MRLKDYFSSNPATFTLIFINIIIFIASHELHIHMLLNMFLVLIFSTQLERKTNSRVIFYVYLLSGFVGSLTILAYAPLIGYDGELIPGASVAAFGIVAAYAALQPNTIILKSKSKYWMIALFIVNAVLTIQNPHVSVGGPAHAAGIVVGLIFGYLLRKKG